MEDNLNQITNKSSSYVSTYAMSTANFHLLPKYKKFLTVDKPLLIVP